MYSDLIFSSEILNVLLFQLKPVEFLLGSSAKLEEIIVLGMLTQLKEGKWYLEDNTGAVQLDLSRAVSYF